LRRRASAGVAIALLEVVDQAFIGVVLAEQLVQVGSVGDERDLGLAAVVERGKAMVRGLVVGQHVVVAALGQGALGAVAGGCSAAFEPVSLGMSALEPILS